MGWNYLSIPKLQRCNRWSLGMDMQFHLTLYQACNYLSMLGLKLNHVSKRGHRGCSRGTINSLASGKFQSNFRNVVDFNDWWLTHLLWNCPDMNVTGPHWWSVNIGAANSLVSSGSKPLPEPMLTLIVSPYGVTRPEWLKEWCPKAIFITTCWYVRAKWWKWSWYYW